MPHDAISTSLEQIQKMTHHPENPRQGPDLREAALQRRDIPYYEYLQTQFVNVRDGITTMLQGGIWNNAADIPREEQLIKANVDARRSIYAHALDRVRLSENFLITSNVPNREQLREGMRQAIIHLDELITAEEYRMTAMQHFLVTAREAAEELRLVPAGERDQCVKQGLRGFADVVARLQAQLTDIQETLRLTTAIYTIRTTIAAPDAAFVGPDMHTRPKVLADLQARLTETRDARRKRLVPPPVNDINYVQLTAAITALETYRKNPSVR